VPGAVELVALEIMGATPFSQFANVTAVMVALRQLRSWCEDAEQARAAGVRVRRAR